MKYMELIAPCHFGMEAVLKRQSKLCKKRTFQPL